MRDYMRMFFSFFAFCTITFLMVTVAIAQGESVSLQELSTPVLKAIMSGDYAAAAALGLVLGVALLRRKGGEYWPSVASPEFVPVLLGLGSFGAALANTLTSGGSLSGATVVAALKVAIYAAGGYGLMKPIVERLRKIAPDWTSPLFFIFDWVFSAKNNALAKAEKAGRIAVEEKPGKGSEIDFKKFP